MIDDRLDELRRSLDQVRERVAAACRAVGRSTDEVTLVAVSKTWPGVDVMRLASLGVTDFGESYDQEAVAKARALAAAGIAVRWHFVGRLQRNKCRSVSSYADVVQSVDRPELADALAAGAAAAQRRLEVLIQVALEPGGAPQGRGGCAPADVAALAGHLVGLDLVELRGVMAVAPAGAPSRAAFAGLRRVAAELLIEHPGATVVSAGMSGDLEDAVAEGATHVRVGTALFGDRPAGG